MGVWENGPHFWHATSCFNFRAMTKVPLVDLVYDPKVEHFLDRVNQPSAGKPGELDLVALCNLLEEALDKIPESQKQLQEIKEQLTVLAKENAKLAVDLLGEDK